MLLLIRQLGVSRFPVAFLVNPAFFPFFFDSSFHVGWIGKEMNTHDLMKIW